MKTEPEVFSYDQLVREGKTNWNGVRNFQARNNLRNCSVGDQVIIYHSGDERAAVGIAEIKKAAYPDLDPQKPADWVQVDIIPLKKLKNAVTLTAIKKEASLKDISLIKQSRLSVMPLEKKHFDTIIKLSTNQGSR